MVKNIHDVSTFSDFIKWKKQWAFSIYKKKSENFYWEFPFGKRAFHLSQVPFVYGPLSVASPMERVGKPCAFHSTKISGLTFRIPLRRTDLVPHFTRQNAEGSWKSGCFKHRKLLPRNKFNTYKILPIFTWPSQTPFSRDESNLRTFLVGKYAREVCKQSELNLRKFGTTSPQFSRKSDSNVENRKSRTGSNCGTLFCIQCSVD